MAIINEEPDSPRPQKEQKPFKPTSKSSESTTPKPTKTTKATNPFHFWFYFTISVSLVTLIFMILASLYTQYPKTWFLSLPPNLRQHYLKGEISKFKLLLTSHKLKFLQSKRDPQSLSIRYSLYMDQGVALLRFKKLSIFFCVKGVHVVAIDLPGSGFSDNTIVVEEEYVDDGVLGRLRDMYSEIQEKSIFWGFDQLVEQGYVNHEENKIRVSKRNIVKDVDLGPEEIGKMLGQVIDTMGLVGEGIEVCKAFHSLA